MWFVAKVIENSSGLDRLPTTVHHVCAKLRPKYKIMLEKFSPQEILDGLTEEWDLGPKKEGGSFCYEHSSEIRRIKHQKQVQMISPRGTGTGNPCPHTEEASLVMVWTLNRARRDVVMKQAEWWRSARAVYAPALVCGAWAVFVRQ